MLKPQLAEPVSLSEIPALCECSNHFAQLKVDGHRRLIYVVDGLVTPLNRRGEPTDLPGPITAKLAPLGGHWAFDGELVGNTLWLFDLIEAGKLLDPRAPFRKRLELLELLFLKWGDGPEIRLLPTFRDTEAKLLFVKRAWEAKAEGVIFRQVDAPYRSGERCRELMKAKFWRDVDCIVLEFGRDGKANIVLGIYDGVHPDPIEIGEVTSLAADGGRCKKDDVVTVRYLNVPDPAHPRLYQPNLPRIRTDKRPEECTIDQLVFANKSVIV